MPSNALIGKKLYFIIDCLIFICLHLQGFYLLFCVCSFGLFWTMAQLVYLIHARQRATVFFCYQKPQNVFIPSSGGL